MEKFEWKNHKDQKEKFRSDGIQTRKPYPNKVPTMQETRVQKQNDTDPAGIWQETGPATRLAAMNSLFPGDWFIIWPRHGFYIRWFIGIVCAPINVQSSKSGALWPVLFAVDVIKCLKTIIYLYAQQNGFTVQFALLTKVLSYALKKSIRLFLKHFTYCKRLIELSCSISTQPHIHQRNWIAGGNIIQLKKRLTLQFSMIISARTSNFLRAVFSY